MSPSKQEVLSQQRQLLKLLANFPAFTVGPPQKTRGATEAFKQISPRFNDNGGELSKTFTSNCIDSPRGLFEYLYIQDNIAIDIFWSVLIDNHPRTLSAFLTNTLTRRALTRLQQFYTLLPLTADIPDSITAAHRKLTQTLKAITDLEVFINGAALSPTDDRQEDDEEADIFGGFAIKKKQGDRKKQAKAAKGHRRGPSQAKSRVVLDPVLFDALGYGPPESKEEAERIASTLVGGLVKVMSAYLNGLVDMATFVQKLFEGHADILTPSPTTSSNNTVGYTSPSKTENPSQPAIPSAYPHIQPLRAAALFEDAASQGDLGEWPILISTRAITHLRQFDRGDAAVFEIVKKKIRELSQGFFSDDNQKKLVGQDNEVPIFEAKMTRDLRLVYQVECGAHVMGEADPSKPKYEKQRLRIWGIYTHAQIDKRFWAQVAYQSVKKGREYRKRCIHREVPRLKSKGQNVTPPGIFPCETSPQSPEVLAKKDQPSVPILGDVDYLNLHAILALEKFIPYSGTLLDTVRRDEDSTHIFAVSPYEEEIIYHPSSCLVIGRSGTGKTTTMLFKMIGLEKAAAETGNKVRQMFVTQSRVLAGRVEEYFKKLQSSSGPGGADKTATKEREKDLLELDDEVEDDSHLPAKWSELEDRHFPLFLTFDQLCKLLEGDCQLKFHHRSQTDEQKKASHRYGLKSIADGQIDLQIADDDLDETPQSPTSPTSPIFSFEAKKKGMLTFEIFVRDIWPHFSQSSAKGLDAALVFSEFMGVIKGSEDALSTAKGYVDRSTYEKMSERTQSTFAKARGRIYTLFESYLKFKMNYGYYDGPDRTHALLRELEKGVPGSLLDFLYVDEVQDNLLLDAGLLRKLCHSPHGMFWAGDTAQTIALGSSFRFDDLKSYLFRIEVADPAVLAGKRHAIHPASFQLSTNYRSHGGIVDAATSVVSLITKLFPHSIDTLAKEQGMVDGPKPIIFSGWGEDVRYEQFLFGEANTPIEFGAEQVILVRNEAARDNLRSQIGGEIGLILTLYESKGLEFSDVLLYNFFTDSPASAAEWRVVLNALEDKERGGVSVPRFDEVKHAALQTELKFLYVGLTRARKHIWIWDSSDKAKAMEAFWLNQKLVKLCIRGVDQIPQLAIQSTSTEWAKSGRLLFQKKLFVQSLFCFEKAGMQVESAIAAAYQSRVEARKLPSGHAKRSDCWRIAAKRFKEAAMISSKSEEQRGLYQRAAACLLEVPDHKEAADAFVRAQEYTNGALYFRKAGAFDESLQVIRTHRQEVDKAVARRITNVIKLAWTKNNQFEKAKDLFESPDDYVEFLLDLGLEDMRLKVLENIGRFDEAASLTLQKGDPIGAIHLLLRSQEPGAMDKAIQTLVDGMWKHYSLGRTKPPDEEIAGLLNIAKSIAPNHDEIRMFNAIQNGHNLTLTELGRRFIDFNHRTAGLLCLDHAFKNPPSLQVETLEKVNQFLNGYQAYGSQIRQLLRVDKDALGRVGYQKLLSYMPLPSVVDDDTHEFIVSSLSSILRPYVIRQPIGTWMETADGYIVNSDTLISVIRTCISVRYNQSMTSLHYLAVSMRALQPCITYAMVGGVGGHCARAGCPHDHVEASGFTAEYQQARVAAHIKIIMLLDGMIPMADEAQRDITGKPFMQRIWLDRLFHTLHPIIPSLGSLASLNRTTFPEFKIALPIIKSWLQERMFSLSPVDRLFRGYMSGVVSVSLLAFTIDYEAAAAYAPRTRCAWATTLSMLRDNRTTVEDCLKWLTGKEESSIGFGSMFLRHVAFTREIPIDINVLITYTERLVTHLIFNARTFKAGKSLSAFNNITLPKTWLVHGLSRTFPQDFIHRANHIIEAIGHLLGLIWQSRGHGDPRQRPELGLLYEGRDITTIPYVLESVFISRLCRSIVLLGYNLNNDGMKTRITQIFTTQGREGRSHDFYMKYVTARNWEQLARAVRVTSLDSPLDELCQTVLVDEPKTLNPIPGVNFIYFSSREDLYQQLGFHLSPIPLISTLNPAAKEFIPAGFSGSVVPVPDPGNGAEVDDQDAEPVLDLKGEAIAVAPSEEEARAVTWCARHYRKMMKYRQSPKGNYFFDRCLAELQKAGSGRSFSQGYSKYFLGPLPHLLAWVERAAKRAVETKRRQSNRLSQVSHEAYDEMMERIDNLSRLRKDLVELSKILAPNSSFHLSASPLKLKDAAKDMLELKERVDQLLGGPSAREVEDFELSYKGLLQQSKPQQFMAPARPSLNTEDLDDM